MRDAPARTSNLRFYIVSVAVHATVIGALVWTATGNKTKPAGDGGIFGSAPRDSARGLATHRSAPPLGRSMPPEKAAPYLGRYVVVKQGRPNTVLLVTLVNDDLEHWTLALQENDRPSYNLVPVAPDSFVQQMDHAQHIVFLRQNDTVRTVELSGRGTTRRGARDSTVKRD